eukprot:8032400-Pyramimonas_sp.AAC.1
MTEVLSSPLRLPLPPRPGLGERRMPRGCCSSSHSSSANWTVFRREELGFSYRPTFWRHPGQQRLCLLARMSLYSQRWQFWHFVHARRGAALPAPVMAATLEN